MKSKVRKISIQLDAHSRKVMKAVKRAQSSNESRANHVAWYTENGQTVAWYTEQK